MIDQEQATAKQVFARWWFPDQEKANLALDWLRKHGEDGMTLVSLDLCVNGEDLCSDAEGFDMSEPGAKLMKVDCLGDCGGWFVDYSCDAQPSCKETLEAEEAVQSGPTDISLTFMPCCIEAKGLDEWAEALHYGVRNNGEEVTA